MARLKIENSSRFGGRFGPLSANINFFLADRVYTGDGRCLPNTAVAMNAQTAQIEALLPAAQAPNARYQPGSLTPGFINAHGHLELSHLHGHFPQHTGLVPFLEAVTRSRGADQETIEKHMQAAAQTLQANGIVAMGDIANTTASIALKLSSTLKFHTFVEVFGMSEQGWPAGLERGLPVLDAFRQAGLAASLSPHAPYSVHPALMQHIGQTSAGLPISIHMQESPEETKFFASGEGAFPSFYRNLGIPVSTPAPGSSSLQTTLSALPAGQRLLLVHNTCATNADLELADHSGHDVFWCLCPGANRYIENRLPELALFRRYPDRVLIGTDSLASNGTLSVLNELQQLLQADPALTPELAIQWACGNAARFFGWSDLGTLEPGKRPGLLHIHPGSDHSPIGAGSSVQVII